MIQDTFTIIEFIFSKCWKLFTHWYIPGTNVTPAGFLLLILVADIVIRFIRRLLADSWHNNSSED